ncbi:hypothetical protein AB0L06_10760 [Spirillospora sp. NPDC052269]
MTDLIRPYQLFDRLGLIMGLRALATFLENNPAVPVPGGTVDLTHFTPRAVSDPCQRAQIDAIAALLDVTAGELIEGGHYVAAKHFGPVAYRAVFIPTSHRHAHRALMSYAENFDQATVEERNAEPGRVA